MWNVNGGYGVIGCGVEASLWQSFIFPANKTATYSLSLARFSNPLNMSRGLEATTYPSNITFGSANDGDYDGADYLSISSLANYTY